MLCRRAASAARRGAWKRPTWIRYWLMRPLCADGRPRALACSLQYPVEYQWNPLEAVQYGRRTGEAMATSTARVTSKDGTKIVYDQIGHGPAVILVAGALCSRSFWSGPALAKLLAPRFTVYNYDRRGRGDSGDIKPYAVEREIENIEALIDEAGGSAYLYGHSSGAALAMEAALRLGNKVKKLAMYEVPYNEDAEYQRAWK